MLISNEAYNSLEIRRNILEYRDIKGFEGHYKISEYGDILNVKTGKLRKLRSNVKHGYIDVDLYKDGKAYYKRVNRLVAEAFLENPNNYPQVNHKDEDKTNNNVDNLEWCDSKYNHNYGTWREKRRGKNNYGARKVICITTGKIFDTIREAAKFYNLKPNNINMCLKGKSKTAGGYSWKYFEGGK